MTKTSTVTERVHSLKNLLRLCLVCVWHRRRKKQCVSCPRQEPSRDKCRLCTAGTERKFWRCQFPWQNAHSLRRSCCWLTNHSFQRTEKKFFVVNRLLGSPGSASGEPNLVDPLYVSVHVRVQWLTRYSGPRLIPMETSSLFLQLVHLFREKNFLALWKWKQKPFRVLFLSCGILNQIGSHLP